MDAFNGNPDDLISSVINPERVEILAPGEPYKLKNKQPIPNSLDMVFFRIKNKNRNRY